MSTEGDHNCSLKRHLHDLLLPHSEPRKGGSRAGCLAEAPNSGGVAQRASGPLRGSEDPHQLFKINLAEFQTGESRMKHETGRPLAGCSQDSALRLRKESESPALGHHQAARGFVCRLWSPSFRSTLCFYPTLSKVQLLYPPLPAKSDLRK